MKLKLSCLPVSEYRNLPKEKAKELLSQVVTLRHVLHCGQWCYLFTLKNVEA